MDNTIPHELVLEFIGHFTFSPNPDRDAAIAINIAENTYTSMEELYSICMVNCVTAIREHDERTIEDFKNNPYFGPWFISNP